MTFSGAIVNVQRERLAKVKHSFLKVIYFLIDFIILCAWRRVESFMEQVVFFHFYVSPTDHSAKGFYPWSQVTGSRSLFGTMVPEISATQYRNQV